MFEYIYHVECGAWSDIVRPNQTVFKRENLSANEVENAILDVIKEATQKMSYDSKFRYFTITRDLVCGVWMINSKKIFRWVNPQV